MRRLIGEKGGVYIRMRRMVGDLALNFCAVAMLDSQPRLVADRDIN